VAEPDEWERLEAAARSDAYWWASQVGAEQDWAAIFCESNLLRYRPLPNLVIRVAPGAGLRDVARALMASVRAGATPLLSMSTTSWSAWDGREHLHALAARAGSQLVVEEPDTLIARLQALGESAVARVRLLGHEPPLLVLEPHVHVDSRPPVLLGQVELLRYVREQTVSRTLHRFGNVVASPDG
jgi:RHH-type proline utilization regulon transcriptional repressor/proline dehydrogenase/delta 1-pyrroline-5-carboxylate dehydrogenase